MSYGISVNTRLAGGNRGNFLDDLTNPSVGQWPKERAIRRISHIEVYSGWVVDSVRITYDMMAGGTKTVQHGGPGGSKKLDISLAETENLVAVYGRRLNEINGDYGGKNIVQLSFVIATGGKTGQDAATCTTHTVSCDWVTHPNSQFQFSWSVLGVSSYTFQPPARGIPYLQGIGFSEILCQADGPF